MKRYSDGAAGGSGANGNGGYSPGRSWKRIRVSYNLLSFYFDASQRYRGIELVLGLVIFFKDLNASNQNTLHKINS
jgi:hypothetical protein